MHIQDLVEICPFALKILSGNELLMSIMGHDSITNVRKRMRDNPNLDLISTNAFTIVCKLLSFCSKDIEQK